MWIVDRIGKTLLLNKVMFFEVVLIRSLHFLRESQQNKSIQFKKKNEETDKCFLISQSRINIKYVCKNE